MNRNLKTIVASLIGVFLLASVAAFGAETNVKGMISGRTGQTLIVTGSQGKTTVLVTGVTRIKDNTGLFGLDKDEMAPTILIPGLKVSVDGTKNSKGQVVATTITVDGDDIESSQMIQSGLQPTADQVVEHEKTLLNHQEQIGGTLPDQWSRRLFTALCRRYGLEPYRYRRQRHTTVVVRAPRAFVNSTLWPEFFADQGRPR